MDLKTLLKNPYPKRTALDSPAAATFAIIENGLEWTGAFKTRFGVSVGYRLGIVFGIGLTKKIPRLLYAKPSLR